MSATEMKQRGAQISQLAYINTTWLTKDEAMVQIIGEQYRILYEYYGLPVYLKGYQMAEDVLYKGLHSASGLTYFGASLDPVLNKIATAIVKGATNSNPVPASKQLSMSERGRTKLRGLDVPYYTKADARQVLQSIGAIVPLLDCEKFNPFTSPDVLSYEEWKADPTTTSGSVPHNLTNYQNTYLYPLSSFLDKKWKACKEENAWRELFNNELAKTAYHPLYAHMADHQFDYLNAKGYGKPAFHKASIGSLSALSTIDYGVIKGWMDTCIMAKNGQAGAGPLTGKQTIDVMIKGAGNETIGEPATIVVVLTLVAKILVAVAAIAGTVLQAIAMFKQDAAVTFRQQSGGFDTPGWGGDKDDFSLKKLLDPNGDGKISLTEMLPFAALGLGGFMLLSDGAESGKKNKK